MSEKKFEECSLQEATHVEVGGKMHELGDGKVLLAYDEDDRDGILVVDACAFIPVDAFPIFGVQPLKKIKPKPIEFEATFVKHDGQWHTLAILNDSFAYLNNKRVRFCCVQILEEEKK